MIDKEEGTNLKPVTSDEVDQIATFEEMHGTGGSWTICEIIRRMYKLAEREGNTEIMEYARTALTMAKKMDKALRKGQRGVYTLKSISDEEVEYGRSDGAVKHSLGKLIGNAGA